MRIISNFKDYYDFPTNHYGIDNKRVYKRKTEEMKSQDIKVITNGKERFITDEEINIGDNKSVFRFTSYPYDADYFFVVCFCDMAYQGFYNAATDTYEYVRENLPEHAIKIDATDTWPYEPRTDKTSRFIPEPTNINQLLGCPVVFLRGYRTYNLTLNKKLADIDFAKVIDPMQAYQKIYTYMGFKEPAVPSDPKDMNRFTAKGFDKKTSFRKV